MFLIRHNNQFAPGQCVSFLFVFCCCFSRNRLFKLLLNAGFDQCEVLMSCSIIIYKDTHRSHFACLLTVNIP